MKIAIVTEWFSEKMGYAENMLPKALAALGHDVDVISSTAQVYFSSPSYKETYEPFLGPNIQPEGIKDIDGFRIHRLPMVRTQGMPGIEGLQKYLEELSPDVIQTFDVFSDSSFDSAMACRNKGIKLFTASHIHASVFKGNKTNWKSSLRRRFWPNLTEKRIQFITDQTICCYPIAPDAARIISEYYHVPKNKIKIQSLGVDMNFFHAPTSTDWGVRQTIRSELGIEDDAILCIYTGRFAKDKNPQCLSQAVDSLQKKGESIFALFIGNGTAEEKESISKCKGCFLKDFVLIENLNGYYWASDIGVWPAQESTSQLDAIACGLPLVLSNRIEVRERVEGNGLLYSEGNDLDLAEKILLLKDPEIRKRFRESGIQKIKNHYTWEAIARSRITDYEALIL